MQKVLQPRARGRRQRYLEARICNNPSICLHRWHDAGTYGYFRFVSIVLLFLPSIGHGCHIPRLCSNSKWAPSSSVHLSICILGFGEQMNAAQCQRYRQMVLKRNPCPVDFLVMTLTGFPYWLQDGLIPEVVSLGLSGPIDLRNIPFQAHVNKSIMDFWLATMFLLNN